MKLKLLFFITLFIFILSEKPIEERLNEIESSLVQNYKDLIKIIDKSVSQVNLQLPLLKNAIIKFIIGGTLIWILIFFFIYYKFKPQTGYQKVPTEEKQKLEFLRITTQPNPSIANFLNVILPGISYFIIQQTEKGVLHVARSIVNIFFVFWFLDPLISMISSDQPLLLIIVALSTFVFFVTNHVIHIYFINQDSSELFSRICRGYPILKGECHNKYVMLGLGELIDVIDGQNPPEEYLEEMKKSEIGE